MRALGLVDSVGIDSVLPNRLNGPNPSHLEHVESLIRNKACVYVHFAPPCGTASRARLIQNSEQNLPPPLRNDQYPNGLPWLTMDQQIRVDKANNLYSITCRLIRLCEDHHILWSCENPGRSFMWQTTPFQQLFSTMQCLSTKMHHCMFGSSRRKLTRLIHNIPSFHHLHQLCDNQHEHEPWGQKSDGSWATAEETAYPWPLARAIAAQVLLQLQDLGVECHPPSFAEQEATLQAMRAATNIQPRKNLPSLVPEFKEITTQVDSASLPSRARKLSTPKRGYVASALKGHVTIGIHFSPEEFIHEALSLRHPTEQQSLFPKEVRENVAHLSGRTVHQVAIERAEQIRKWTAYAIDTDKEERAAKSNLKEVEKGFLEGPVCRSSRPPGSTLTKRFPVKQKNKVRPIDDYKASLVNFAVAQNEGVTIHTIDHIASMTACCTKSGNLSQEDPLVAKCSI